MKKATILSLIILSTLIVGCADTQTRAAFNGGYLASSTADYIVISESGGVIMDVWKVKDSFVSSAKMSDGWIFEDKNGDAIAIGGDVKVIRVYSSETWDSYSEYHAEFELQTYQEKNIKQ